LLAGVLSIALASQAGAGTAQAPATDPVSEPTLMIVEFPRGARFIGFPRRCPGSTEDVKDDEICLAELYEGRARIVRHLSGPPVRWGERLRLTAHARNWPAGTTMMVLTRPFDDHGTTGNFAFWWDLPNDGDNYCLTTESLADWGDDPVSRQFAKGYRRRFRPDFYVERTDFRCIKG
jgi:hypothetical protein